MVKNQIIIGECVDYTYDGLGVVKFDAFCVFVKDMIKGETGKIVITLVKKNYAYGHLVELIKPSKHRVQPVCKVSKQCGGCQLQHMSYNQQLEFKKQQVENQIRQIGKIDTTVNDVLGMQMPLEYRNKVQLPTTIIDNQLVTGFYSVNSHRIIQTDNCPLQSKKANKVVDEIRSVISDYDIKDKIRHIMLRELKATNQVMVVIVSYSCTIDSQIIDRIKNIDSSIVSIIQNVNDEDTNVVLSKKNVLLYGQDYVLDILCGLKFKISVNSFYQVNTTQTQLLYNTAIKLANITKEDTVLDLYCGVGTIGLIASKYAKKVVGVEIVQQAIDNAKENAKINDIENEEFVCGDVGKIIDRFTNNIDVIFVDPPRKGCDQNTLNHLVSINPKRIVYVSCNPATLARDLNYLKQYYSIDVIQPVDMFPQTHHCETICLLTKK